MFEEIVRPTCIFSCEMFPHALSPNTIISVSMIDYYFCIEYNLFHILSTSNHSAIFLIIPKLQFDQVQVNVIIVFIS